MKNQKKAVHIKEIIGDIRKTTRLAYGTKTKNWHLIKRDDRDWNYALTWAEITSMTEDEAITEYFLRGRPF